MIDDFCFSVYCAFGHLIDTKSTSCFKELTSEDELLHQNQRIRALVSKQYLPQNLKQSQLV